MNNSRLFRLSRIVIALTAASGMMVNTANAKEEAKAATQYTQQVNQNYAKSLPFSDRQDFDDAQRGFIAPLLDEGIHTPTFELSAAPGFSPWQKEGGADFRLKSDKAISGCRIIHHSPIHSEMSG